MSWDGYIVELKKDSGITEAAIYGKEGWVGAATDMFKDITSDQIKALSAGPGNGSTVTLAGVKAMVLRNELDYNNTITLVTMKNTMISESRPLVIGFSNTALIIGLGSPKDGRVGISVEKTTKYLKENSY